MPQAIDLGVDDVLDVVQNVFNISGEQYGDEFQMLCPNPKHNDRNPSTSVNLKTGYWNCFSCGIGGDLAKLGSVKLGLEREVVEGMLKPTSAEGILNSVRAKLDRMQVTSHMRREHRKLPGPYSPGPLDELIERGFTKRTLKRYGIRFANVETLQGRKGEFTIQNSIAIPIRDANGKLLFWCYRATKQSPQWQQENLRYVYTDHTEVSEFWFGLQHHARAREITVVEGALDSMWLDQAGFPSLALLGSKMGERKLLWLQRFQRVYLLGDRDTAGSLAVKRMGELLGQRLPLYVLRYPRYTSATDPQELHPVDLEIMHELAMPWQRFKARQSRARV